MKNNNPVKCHTVSSVICFPLKLFIWFSALFSCFDLSVVQAQNLDINPAHTIPYPKSELIKQLVWTSAPYTNPGTGSDMHWWTWGADDNLYVLDDDGANFGGPDTYAHLLKIKGTPPHHHVETVTDFTDIPFRKMLPQPLLRRYVNGPVAVGKILYVSIYDYDWNIKRILPYYDSVIHRTPLYRYNEQVKDTHFLSAMYFTDSYSKNYGTAGIIKSMDGGKSWTNIPDSTTPRFLGPKFGGLCFVNFGPGYSNVPKSLGPYVYAMSNDVSWESGDHVYMAKVHRDSILFRSAWLFLNSVSEKNVPSWTSSEDSSYPIFTDTGHTGHPTISYNTILKRYILGIYSDVVPHSENASQEQWSTWDVQTELQLYESQNPWGPWKIFHNESPFGGQNHSAYLPQIPNKWWSADGLNNTMMFAGDYTKGTGGYYSLMMRSFKLELYPSSKKKTKLNR